MDKAWVVAALDGIARFGKGERGFSRLVFGEAEWGAVEYVTGLMREAALAVRTDAFGNVTESWSHQEYVIVGGQAKLKSVTTLSQSTSVDSSVTVTQPYEMRYTYVG